MICTSSLYEACYELFAGYPLAASAVNHRGTIRSMVLMLRDGDEARFFILLHDCSEDQPFYSLHPWRGGDIVDIRADSRAAVSDLFVDAVARGLPIPRHGSLFGWSCEDTVTALIAVYAEYTPASPEPGWSVMPLADIPEMLWPPFTGERLFGQWFWEHHRAGNIVSVVDLIAGTPDTVFWTDTKAILGSDCCVVARDIRGPEGPTLQYGRYVYYQALRADKPVPSLTALLADASKTDLASRFRGPVHTAMAGHRAMVRPSSEESVVGQLGST